MQQVATRLRKSVPRRLNRMLKTSKTGAKSVPQGCAFSHTLFRPEVLLLLSVFEFFSIL